MFLISEQHFYEMYRFGTTLHEPPQGGPFAPQVFPVHFVKNIIQQSFKNTNWHVEAICERLTNISTYEAHFARTSGLEG